MRPLWRARSSGRRDGSGRQAVSPPPTSWSSRLAAGRHISVCTCVPVCLHLGVRACAFMCVCLRVPACARGEPPSPGADVRSRGGWALSERSVRLASLRRTDRSRSRLTRGDVDAADPQICPHEGPAWPKLPGSDAGSPAARHPTSASGQRGPVAEDSRGRVAP